MPGGTKWYERPAGKWVTGAAAWVIGVAAGVQQFVQSAVSGPSSYAYFFGVFAIVVGFVVVAYAFRSTPAGTIAQYLLVLISIVPLLLGSIIVGYQLAADRRPPPSTPGVAVSITSPVMDARVGHTIQVDGVVVNLPADKQIWIAATGRMDGDLQVPYQFYVQPGPCIYANNGFSCPGINVGIESDTSRYELIPIVADKAQEKAFEECLKDLPHQLGCAPVRPDGAQLGSGVFVQRQ